MMKLRIHHPIGPMLVSWIYSALTRVQAEKKEEKGSDKDGE
jgi:hypothetical protein